LGTEPVDILIGHEAPRGLHSLDEMLRATEPMWSQTGLAYADSVRDRYMEGFRAVRPRLSFSGHYHAAHAGTVTTVGDDGVPFTTRAFVLAAEGSATQCIAVLDMLNNEVELLSLREART